MALDWAEALANRLQHARKKHPEGADLWALMAELCEVFEEFNASDAERYKDELLDVATVAIRIYLGEVSELEQVSWTRVEQADELTA